MKFVGALLIFYSAIVAIIYMGLYFSNGWVISAGVIALLCHKIRVDDDKVKENDINNN